ncbi:hypothetical protein [Thermoplasma volcanium GSS1]|uniref:HTH marR-type domain-containing protein n=1 Tax=Thermoplasma volcanium (strain ATCC 51530 / DSM 4299 / JCM 9571 / NBRC 15438 / GSS1) TaxID=273116 RepID=Q979H4_THEVO|nr:MarR family transcriptional regulator [Thermoplasma volcanium]BAB60329.1 hypothetical protein [Thermoplasma volcanium GSS1]
MIEEKCTNLMDIWHMFIRVFNLSKKKMGESLSHISAKPIEVRILYLLSEDESTVNKLAELTDVTPAWITGTLDEMESQGLIVRSRSGEDRRVVNVHITEKGIEVLNESQKVYLDFLKRSLSSLTDSELDEFRRILKKIEETLQ